jgi:glutamate-1-semialdehyde 2,1-aminomutase
MSDILPRAATLSKGPEFYGVDFHPPALAGGSGARVFGNDGNTYLDWVSSLGSNLLGHGDPGWTSHMQTALAFGTGFSLPHMLEQAVAEKLVAMLGAHVPGWGTRQLSVRFGLSGSDACSMAVRLARAVTHRHYVISIGYHGWSAEFVGATKPAWGVTQQAVIDCPFGDIATLEHFISYEFDAAAVIVEQAAVHAPDGYWQQLQALCRDHGALLIMDEVVTGLRFGLGGAAAMLGVTPDIICMGKALGNGVPISAMVFPREMASWFARKDPVFVSSTHFGCTVGLASAQYVLDNWGQAQVDHLHTVGKALLGGMELEGYNTIGWPAESLLRFDTPAQRGFFIAGMRDRGILMNRPNLPCLAHTLDDVVWTVKAAREVMAEMQKIDVEAVMAGKLPAVLFENR